MKQPGHLKVACVHCGQHIEFPRELLGTILDCPDCGLSTPLQIAGLKNPGPGEGGGFSPRLPDTIPEGWQSRPRKSFPIGGVIALAAIGVVLVLIYGPQSLLGLIGLCAIVVIYFLPSMIGRNKRNATAIMVLNLFLGWTLVGWVVALVWACTVEKDRDSK